MNTSLQFALGLILCAMSLFAGWTVVASDASSEAPLTGAVPPAHERPPGRELSAFEQALQMNENVSTRESIVQLGARKFRRIQISSEIFYLQLQTELSTEADLALLCGENPAQFGANSPALLNTAVRVSKRTRFFVEGLRKMCTGTTNQPRIGIAPEIAIGFMMDDDPAGRAAFTNRRISINPFALVPHLNFNADF